jgi:hypothetical protein
MKRIDNKTHLRRVFFFKALFRFVKSHRQTDEIEGDDNRNEKY